MAICNRIFMAAALKSLPDNSDTDSFQWCHQLVIFFFFSPVVIVLFLGIMSDFYCTLDIQFVMLGGTWSYVSFLF